MFISKITKQISRAKKSRNKMYVTKPLSLYRKSPEELSLAPPEGPNSGILVIQDREAMPTCCLGLCHTDKLRHLPLPQNKDLELYYAQNYYPGIDLHFHSVLFIPVLNQPLSSNLYYAIQPFGKDRGKAFTSSKEEDLEAFCFSSYAPDSPPQSLDTKNPYQQMKLCLQGRKIIPCSSGFVAKSVASDGYLPGFLGRKGWKLGSSDSRQFELGDANGLDTDLRARLPNFDFPLENDKSNPVIVGKWYCPFMFVKEGTPKTLIDEMNRTIYYEVTLEQSWVQIFTMDSTCSEGNSVIIDNVVQTEVVMVEGRTIAVDERKESGGFLWFRSFNNLGEEKSVGLSLAVVERMKWEEERFGFVNVNERQRKIERVEEYKGLVEWKRFGCYVLNERFVLKRLGGRPILNHDFRHIHQIRSKWE